MLKPVANYAQQVDEIIRKGIIVNNPVELEQWLAVVNYYRLSAYFLPYKTRQGMRSVNINQIIGSYMFDSELRGWLYEIIGDIELYTRTVLASHLGMKYGPDGYLNADIYNPKHRHEIFLNRLENTINENRKTDVVRHHQANYDGKFPLWVVIEFFSMGMLSFFYADLQRVDKKEIAKTAFNTGDRQLESWLRALTELRNKCAHYTRFYYWRFTSVPRTPANSPWNTDNTLFSQIYMLSKMYPDKTKWNSYVGKLVRMLGNYSGSVQLAHIGFPEKWWALLKTSEN